MRLQSCAVASWEIKTPRPPQPLSESPSVPVINYYFKPVTVGPLPNQDGNPESATRIPHSLNLPFYIFRRTQLIVAQASYHFSRSPMDYNPNTSGLVRQSLS